MRASRLLTILLLLQARGRVTAPALAEELEVSVRTIYRDMDDLSAAGVPVYADRGSAGGFQLLDGYRTQLTGLTPDEAGALFLFGLPNAAADLGLGEAMTNARRKIDAALPDTRRRSADIVSKRFHLDTTDWFKSVERPEFLSDLADAVWNARRITVRYNSWSAKSVNTLAPVGIVLKAGVWYLVALGRQATPATYRVSSILSLSVTDEAFERPTDFDLGAYWATSVQEFAKRLHRGTATLRVTGRGYDLVCKLGAEVAAAAAKSRKPSGEQGWSIVEIPVEREENAVCDILSLGLDAELLGPISLVRALSDSIGNLSNRYGLVQGGTLG